MRFRRPAPPTATVLTGQRGRAAGPPPSPPNRGPGSQVSRSCSRSPQLPRQAIRARAFDRVLLAYQSDPRTWTVLVGIDLDVKPGVYTVTIESGASMSPHRATHRLDVKAKTFRTRTLKVDEAFVNPPASAQARIAQDSQDMARCWREAAPRSLWTMLLWCARFRKRQIAPSAPAASSTANREARTAAPNSRARACTPVAAPGGGRVVLAKDPTFSGRSGGHRPRRRGLLDARAPLHKRHDPRRDRGRAATSSARRGPPAGPPGPHLHWTLRVNGARWIPLAFFSCLGENRKD